MRNYPKKSEILLRMDSAVILQKAAAYRIAASLNAAFLPVNNKKAFVGWIVPAAVKGIPSKPIRLEVRCRSFASTVHTSTLIEKRVADLLTNERTIYAECFTDDVAVVYDLESVRNLLVWNELGMSSVTVTKSGKKVPKVSALMPYALGKTVKLRTDINRDIASDPNDVTIDRPLIPPTPLF